MLPRQRPFSSSALTFLLLHFAALGCCRLLPPSQHHKPPCHPVLFVFGASLLDVGENAAAMPLRSAAEFSPYGMDYFHHPAGRFSNGRVLIDFISQELGHGFIDPFLESVSSNFTHGVNFASSGSTARNSTVQGIGQTSSGLFSLGMQVDQFRQFKSKLRNPHTTHPTRLPALDKFPDAIYLIDIGVNDYLSTAFRTPDFDSEKAVSTTITAMEHALKDLYDLGARNIIIMNIIPLGCTPAILASFGDHDVDENGCSFAFNDLVKLHNSYLEKLLNTLSSSFTSANLILFDAYAVYVDAVRNPSRYGLKYPMRACCGAGGKYNFMRGILCGSSGDLNGTLVEAKRCADPSLYISWDGLHPVESFAKHMAYSVLSGSHLRPKFLIQEHCNRNHRT